MNEEEEINICEEKLKKSSKSKRKRSQVKKQQRKRQKNANRIQCNLSETAVKTHDASHSLLNAGASSTNEEFRSENQENTDLRHDTNVFAKGNSFQEDVEMLLDTCQSEHSQIRTKEFYCNKIEALHKNHIQVLMKENADFGQSIEQQNINKVLIYKRLNSIRKVLRKLKENRFSGLQLDKFLRKQYNRIYSIKSKLNKSVSCKVKKPAKTENIKERLKLTKIELKAVRKELKNKVQSIQQHSQNALKRNVEIKKLKLELNMYRKQLTQTLDTREAVCKELIGEMNNEHGTLTEPQLQAFCKENCARTNENTEIQLVVSQQELENVKKMLNSKINIIEKTVQQKLLINRHLKDAKKDNEVLEAQLAQTKKELESVKKKLDNQTRIIQQKAQDEKIEVVFCKVTEQNRMKQLNEHEKIHKNKLTQTPNELEGNFKNEVHTVQQQSLHEQKIKEVCCLKKVELLESQLTETRHELEIIKKDLSNKVITIQQKAHHEQEVKKKLNKAEEDIKLLQRQLAETEHERLELFRHKFLKIRLMLATKLGFVDQNGHQWLENYMREESCQVIESDILRLIEEQVPSLDESIPKTVIDSNILKVKENELHLLILIASILKVLQFSASLDAIYSFVAEVDNVISRQDVESLLKKFPTLFKEESVGSGSSNKNWRYLYLKPIITI